MRVAIIGPDNQSTPVQNASQAGAGGRFLFVESMGLDQPTSNFMVNWSDGVECCRGHGM